MSNYGGQQFGGGNFPPPGSHFGDIPMQNQPQGNYGGYVPPGQYPGPGGYPAAPPGQYPAPGQYAPPGQPGYPGQPGHGYAPPGQPGYPGQPGQGYPPSGMQSNFEPSPYGGGGFGSGQPYNGPPITNQPGGWMNIPQGMLNCPPGLEYLQSIDQLLVHQKVELLEAFTGFETNNKYTIKNSLGQKVYWAVEENDCCTRNCCGPKRPFDMKILDAHRNQVIHLNRPLACDSCCFPCCLQSMEVSSPPGTVVGSIEQNWSICNPNFSLKNSSGETILTIEGPVCTFSICGDVEFQIKTTDGTNVGTISKQWSGLAREIFTDADHFGISFPLDLDVRMKAVCLGAVFLIDAMFFEKSGNQESDRPGML